ncbi:spore coat protein [Bacillus sp. FJAT-53711]|uniref:Spore coat protein n=1 Tax=Bacillus yunxiaonensis TaxID=3127665 RepID=A0ABU8FWZ0_9BACI
MHHCHPCFGGAAPFGGAVSPFGGAAPFGGAVSPFGGAVAPITTTPPIVHPTKCCETHTFSKTVVPHIHPTHMKHIHHQVVQSQHYFPQTNSAATVIDPADPVLVGGFGGHYGHHGHHGPCGHHVSPFGPNMGPSVSPAMLPPGPNMGPSVSPAMLPPGPNVGGMFKK